MKQKGFTLIESITVITLIIILASTISLSLFSLYGIERDKGVENELVLLSSSAKAYHLAFPKEGVITQEKLVDCGFLSEILPNRKGYHYQVSIQDEKIIVTLVSSKGVYTYRDGREAKIQV